MVTSINKTPLPPTYSAEHEVFVENLRAAIEQPFICVNSYILACRFDGERCLPTFAIGMPDLLNAVRTELEAQREKGKISTKQASPLLSPPKLSSPIPPHPLSYSRRRLFLQNSRENNRKRFSDDLTGVSYDNIENNYRNSFILPTPDTSTSSSLSASFHSSENSPSDAVHPNLNKKLLTELDSQKLSELEPQIQWVQKHCSDYISTETVHNCAELNTLLNILLRMPSATLITMKIVGSSEINVTYQFMDKFKQDYMVIKISSGYAMLMKAF